MKKKTKPAPVTLRDLAHLKDAIVRDRGDAVSAAMSYDGNYHDLAEHFLQDEPRTTGDAQELAQVIQTAVEDWFASRMPKCERCDGSGEIARSIYFPCDFVAAGPVPDNATGVAASKCDLCGGSGRTEKEIAF